MLSDAQSKVTERTRRIFVGKGMGGGGAGLRNRDEVIHVRMIGNASSENTRFEGSGGLPEPAEGERLEELQSFHFFENYKELLRKRCHQPPTLCR